MDFYTSDITFNDCLPLLNNPSLYDVTHIAQDELPEVLVYDFETQ